MAKPCTTLVAASWPLYQGVYAKTHHDIYTASGRIHWRCWPNGGVFFCCTCNAAIPEADVLTFRQTPRIP